MKQQAGRRLAVSGRILPRRRVRASRARDSITRDRLCGVTYRIVTDNQGSVRLVVNAETGEVAQRLDYDSFGRVLRDTNPGFQPFGFQGGLYDPDTGLVEFGCRWYDAETGRWISKDPILLDGGWNVYAFCGNDPVNNNDSSGFSQVIIMGTDGIETRLQNPSLNEFRSTIGGRANGSIANLTIYDHGNVDFMSIDGENRGIVVNPDDNRVYFDDDATSFSEFIGPKMAEKGTILLSGCRTADNCGWFSTCQSGFNISKALSLELPGVKVVGNRRAAIGFKFGVPTWNIGIRRTYVNGIEK
ncbi:MAG: RHS repeat-associated core domain-containing protein [Kiritimatiellae bacterium]|nr:RHS repeat-associated core domain-containing protein [Kiritimatiellia bacterium]